MFKFKKKLRNLRNLKKSNLTVCRTKDERNSIPRIYIFSGWQKWTRERPVDSVPRAGNQKAISAAAAAAAAAAVQAVRTWWMWPSGRKRCPKLISWSHPHHWTHDDDTISGGHSPLLSRVAHLLRLSKGPSALVARQQPDTKIQMSQSLDQTHDLHLPAGSKENGQT